MAVTKLFLILSRLRASTPMMTCFYGSPSTAGYWGFAPIKINSDTQSRLGSGHDHYQSAIAVDKRGVVAACWYDRRADSEDFAIRHHCGESTNNGFTWADADINAQPFAPTHGNDIFVNPIYMGDYDVLTSDFMNHNSGLSAASRS